LSWVIEQVCKQLAICGPETGPDRSPERETVTTPEPEQPEQLPILPFLFEIQSKLSGIVLPIIALLLLVL
jgi:hypothetical protein